MNCNSFQQLTKDTVRNRKKVSSTLKEKIYRNDSSVKDTKFHRKIPVLIPEIRSHKQHSLSKAFFRKHDEMQAFPGWHFSQNLPTLWPFLYFRVFYSVVDGEIIIE